jgi:hypothetical protein
LFYPTPKNYTKKFYNIAHRIRFGSLKTRLKFTKLLKKILRWSALTMECLNCRSNQFYLSNFFLFKTHLSRNDLKMIVRSFVDISPGFLWMSKWIFFFHIEIRNFNQEVKVSVIKLFFLCQKRSSLFGITPCISLV